MTRITLSNTVLFSEVSEMVGLGHRVQIAGKGNSMFPLIRDKVDMIVLQKTDNHSIQKGNLLLVKLAKGNYVLHRVRKYDDNTVILQGDANLYGFETCKKENVIAEAVEVIRGEKRITKKSFLWKLCRLLSMQHNYIRRVVLAVWRRV